MLRVFISSTIRDLSYVRSTIANRMERELGHDIVISESIDFNYRGQDIIRSCLQEVEASDVYVLIFGHSYGSLATQQGKSITHLEYLHAVKNRKPIIVLCTKDTWVRYLDDSHILEQQLKDFIKEVGDDFRNNIRRFETPDEAYEYVRAQMSILLSEYARLGNLPSEIRDIMDKENMFRTVSTFAVGLLDRCHHINIDFDRLVGDAMNALQTDKIRIFGASMYCLSGDGNFMERRGRSGVGGKPSYPVNDLTKFVCSCFDKKASILNMVTNIGQEEYIHSALLAEKYVFTIHFRVIIRFADEQAIMDEVQNEKNHIIFETLNRYLERT